MHTRLLVILLTAASAASAGVARADVALDVSPIRFEVQTDAGAEYTNAIRVENTGAGPVRVQAYLKDWRLDELGTPRYAAAGSTPQSACPWITLAPADFLLEPGEVRSVRFTVQVPAGTAPRGYRSALLIQTLPVERANENGRRVFVHGQVACMLYVNVGEGVRAAEIASLSTVVREGKPRLKMRVHNTGDVHLRLAGQVVCSAKGEATCEPVALPDLPVLPGAYRWVEVDLPKRSCGRGAVAQVQWDVPGYGRLIGEHSLEAARAALGL